MPIYVNNLQTDASMTDDMISLSAIFNSAYVGTLDMSQYAEQHVIKITLDTAAGFVTITLVHDTDAGKVDVSYSTNIKGTQLDSDDIGITTENVLMTAETLENILGYDVEVYDDFINIVTDNHNLFSSATILDYYETADQIDNTKGITSVDELDPANPIPVSKLEPKTEEQPKTEETSKPTERKSSDGKYDLAATDIENPDGTFTVNLKDASKKDLDKLEEPFKDSYLAENFEYLADEGDTKHWNPNPSKIPYSEITVDNAAEAFPFLGYIGYTPDYVEVLSTDNKDTVIQKLWYNLVGDSADNFSELYQYHAYASEAEYKQALADQEAEKAAMDKREAEAKADTGPIGGNLSTEEAWDFFGW